MMIQPGSRGDDGARAVAAAVGQLPQLQKLELMLARNSLSPGPQIGSKRQPLPKAPPPPAQRRRSEEGASGPAAGAAHPGEDDPLLKAGGDLLALLPCFWGKLGAGGLWGVSGLFLWEIVSVLGAPRVEERGFGPSPCKVHLLFAEFARREPRALCGGSGEFFRAPSLALCWGSSRLLR